MTEIIRPKLFLNSTAISIITLILSFLAGYFPYPILAKFIFNVIWDYVFQFWGATLAIPNITSLRIALTPLLLVGILLFLLLQKLSSMCEANQFANLKWISLVCSWYCLIMTLIVILVMWLDLKIVYYGPDGITVEFGHYLWGVVIQ